MKFVTRLILALICAALTTGLFACGGDTSAPSGGTHGNGDPLDGQRIYAPYLNTVLVLGDGVTESDVWRIKNAYYKATGKAIEVKTDADTAVPHEIIIGKNGRELSAETYNMLNSLEKGDEEAGYLIYTDGMSLAIAFDEAYGEKTALYEAVDVLVTKYMQNESLKFEGACVIESEAFDPIARQAERDTADTEALWETKRGQLTDKMDNPADAEVVFGELKKLYGLFDGGDIAAWLSGLYDKERGGFYYSASAKDSDTYLPDLESTHNALKIIEYILADCGVGVSAWLGEDISYKTAAFVKGMQDKDNGYFYHPQWNREDIDKNKERRERDLFDAVNILRVFGESPIYGTEDGILPAAALTYPLNQSGNGAVKLINSSPEDEYYIPPYLRSATEFSTYIYDLSITKNTDEACERILSEIPLYKSAEKVAAANGEKVFIMDTLVNSLNRSQLSNGLWTKDTDLYTAVENLSEIAKIYNAIETPMPKAGEIFNSVLKCLDFKEDFSDIRVISGTWLALSAVTDNLRTYTVDEMEKDTLSWRLTDLYAALAGKIGVTRERLSAFVRGGVFTSALDNTASSSYGMPVSVPDTSEGDMQGAYQAVKVMWLSVFNVFDIGNVPIFTDSDRMLLNKALLER